MFAAQQQKNRNNKFIPLSVMDQYKMEQNKTSQQISDSHSTTENSETIIYEELIAVRCIENDYIIGC